MSKRELDIWSQWEHGKKDPPYDYLKALVKMPPHMHTWASICAQKATQPTTLVVQASRLRPIHKWNFFDDGLKASGHFMGRTWTPHRATTIHIQKSFRKQSRHSSLAIRFDTLPV